MADGAQNVRVAVRSRPLTEKEITEDCKPIVTVDLSSRSATVVHPELETTSAFVYDYVYDENSTQMEVFEDLGSPVLDYAFKGFNATIFAYGQTGSGKTHTMVGGGALEDQITEQPGMIPMFGDHLFQRIQALSEVEDVECTVVVTFMELYNEVIRDLFQPTKIEGKDFTLQSSQSGLRVEGLEERLVTSASDLRKAMRQGLRTRSIGSTRMNDRSSRAHTICTITLTQERPTDTTDVDGMANVLTSKINLVDLAGSERVGVMGSKGQQFKEGTSINKSLAALGNVIGCLVERKSGHIPYRDSKLTRLLQESLGGNSVTCMIATISPTDVNYAETLSTLSYANRAKQIRNVTTANKSQREMREDKNMIISELREEVERLTSELDARPTLEDLSSAKSDSAAAQSLAQNRAKEIESLRTELHETYARVETLERSLKETKRAMANQVSAANELIEREKRELMEKEKIDADAGPILTESKEKEYTSRIEELEERLRSMELRKSQNGRQNHVSPEEGDDDVPTMAGEADGTCLLSIDAVKSLFPITFGAEQQEFSTYYKSRKMTMEDIEADVHGVVRSRRDQLRKRISDAAVEAAIVRFPVGELERLESLLLAQNAQWFLMNTRHNTNNSILKANLQRVEQDVNELESRLRDAEALRITTEEFLQQVAESLENSLMMAEALSLARSKDKDPSKKKSFKLKSGKDDNSDRLLKEQGLVSSLVRAMEGLSALARGSGLCVKFGAEKQLPVVSSPGAAPVGSLCSTPTRGQSHIQSGYESSPLPVVRKEVRSVGTLRSSYDVED
eukprot:Rmarinus@m.24104